MWRNYLTVAFRSLLRNRMYAFINVFGLAVGIAACLLLILYVRYETSYDSWLPDSERIVQVQATWHEPGQPISPNQASPIPVRNMIQSGFPEIEAVSIAMPRRRVFVRDGAPLYVQTLIVDPAFFDIFQLPFVHGSGGRALPNLASVVLTESEAVRQFGTANAVGRTVTIGASDERRDYQVTGVIRDLPRNTHMRFDALLRFDPAYFDTLQEGVQSWGEMSQLNYVKLRPGADLAAMNARLPAWELRVIPSQQIDGRSSSRADIMDLAFVPVGDVHLGAAQGLAMSPGNDRRTVATFAIAAFLILLMASINFVNLSTARAGQRAREVALRKVLGAERRQLVGQFLGESVLLAGIAMLIGLTMVEFALPFLSNTVGADLRIDYLGATGYALPALGLTLLVGLVGGAYPAFYLSRFQPAQVLKANKGSTDTQGSGRLRNLLVVTQFAIAIGLISCTWVIYSQTEYVQNVDPGFRRDGLIEIEGASRLWETGNYDSVAREMAAVPGVAGVGRTNIGIATENKSIQAVIAPGAPEGLNMGVYRVDKDFFATMEMRLLAGRLLGDRETLDRVPRDPQTIAADFPALARRGLNVVINRRAALLLGYRDPSAAVGRPARISMGTDDLIPVTVAGVVEDTRIRTARDEIEPLVFAYDPLRTTQFIVRYRAADPSAVMAGLRNVWARFLPEAPFEGAFAEDLIAELYQRERARGAIFAAFSGLAVLIACLGLFGLASFTAARRTKEIGIRKVLGARVRDIVKLLVWQFTKPVVIANLIAWPAAWWVLRDWLNTFDLRIDLGPGPFALAGLIAFAIAVGTIAGHAIRVARTNPIHALRYE